MGATASQVWTFFKNFVCSPASVGSVVPSSRYLVSAMVSLVEWQHVKHVAELGAGTGVITRSIDESRMPDSRFYCFERDEGMRLDLAQKFRNIDFYQDAFMLRNIIKPCKGQGLDCVISGLPFANFRPSEREQILRDVYDCLNPGGTFLAFQYSRVLQPYLVAAYGKFESRLVWANIPPAFVFLCQKDKPPLENI